MVFIILLMVCLPIYFIVSQRINEKRHAESLDAEHQEFLRQAERRNEQQKQNAKSFEHFYNIQVFQTEKAIRDYLDSVNN